MSESTDVAELPAALIQQFAQMVTIVPDFEAGGGEKIIEQILNAKTLGDVDAPWTGGRKMPVGRTVYITGIKKAPSDYMGGLPFYLIVECVSPTSGEVTEYSAGGTAVVAQLVKILTLKEFPVAGSIVEVEVKSAPGNKAQHFAISAEDTAYVRETLAGKSSKK